MSESAAERLTRVLALVPYISRRPGVKLTELAGEFGVSRRQVDADLDLLMVCGLPGYYPDDLIDVVLDEDDGSVSIAFDAGIEQPVRLTADEAVALRAALRALADLPGLLDADAVRSALSKLEGLGPGGSRGAADSEVRGADAADSLQVIAADPAPALPAVRQALDTSRQLWIRYYTASRDAVSERVVDPVRLLVTDGQVYLEGYCHLAEGIRHFRVDRMDEARVLDEPAQAPLWIDEAVPEHMFTAAPGQSAVTLLLDPPARWVSEYYQVDEVVEVPGEGEHPVRQRVRLRAGGDEWLIRLVLSLGGAARILDRPDLSAAVAERAAAALEQYR